MNRQPYGSPPRSWHAIMTPWWVRLSRRTRWRQLHQRQQIQRVDVENVELLRSAVDAGQGVMITPNHSAHYDSAALYHAGDKIDLPLYFMTAWQVFHLSSRFECWAMQRMGCFSVDRESNDRQAYKQAVQVLQQEPYPLVIFPEGDIYHTTDKVTPFREGAAAIALSAAKRATRPVVIVPCGIKFYYLDDPRPSLLKLMRDLEQRLYLRNETELALPERIHRIAEAALALKELDYLGHTRQGRLRDRVLHLTEAVLQQLESRHPGGKPGGTPPERVKVLRQTVIQQLESVESSNGSPRPPVESLHRDMEDLFFVMQLFSYRGDYLVENPSVERLAETMDKFEEDILGRDLPTVHGRRRVEIRFGEPLEATPGGGRGRTAELTQTMQSRVQDLIDELNQKQS